MKEATAPVTVADPFDAGPYAHIQAALHLPAASEPGPTARRAALVSVVAWLPLLVLTVAVPHAGLRSVDSFLRDVTTHALYLLALPILILAEAWCLPALARYRRHLSDGGLVGPEDELALEGLAARARRSLDGRGIEAALAASAYLLAVGLTIAVRARTAPVWMAPSDTTFSPAGWWRATVSQPLLLLMIIAWLWRLCVWARFLVGVAGLPLRLIPAHPDLAGGLGFMSGSLRAFAPVGLGLGAVISAGVARTVVAGAPVPPSTHLWVAAAVIAGLFAAPLLVFAVPLRRARRSGALAYSALAMAMGRRFEQRWLGQPSPVTSESLSVQDFSATTDLYSIAANAWGMRIVPIGVKDLSILLGAIVVPFVPLALLVAPLSQILKEITGFLL